MRKRRGMNLRERSRAPREFRVENRAGDEAHIYLFSEIGFWGVTADEFARDLQEVTASRIVLHLNSPGGEAWDGQAMYHALRDHPAEVEVRVEGVAASAASTVAMAGDRVVMARHSMMMIHDPWMLTVGDARDHQRSVEMLDKLGDAIAGFYADRAGGSVREWRETMLAETWYSDREAVEAGLADEVAGDSEAENRFDLSLFDFRNTPPHLKQSRSGTEREPTKREAERALREAGFSAAAAKAVLASGWSAGDDGPRDEALADLAAFLKELNEGALA